MYTPEYCAQSQDCLSGGLLDRLGQMAHWMWLHPFMALFCIALLIASMRMWEGR